MDPKYMLDLISKGYVVTLSYDSDTNSYVITLYDAREDTCVVRHISKVELDKAWRPEDMVKTVIEDMELKFVKGENE